MSSILQYELKIYYKFHMFSFYIMAKDITKFKSPQQLKTKLVITITLKKIYGGCVHYNYTSGESKF